MSRAVILLGLFVVLACGGCIQGPEDEQGFNFRQNTMITEWPSPYDTPTADPKPRGPLDQS